MKLDVDYVVADGEIIIVDEFTGRLMQGRRYSDGLHQAIEAKESLKGTKRKYDFGDDYVAKLFPDVSKASWDDRNSQNRGRGIQTNLWHGGRGNPYE